MQESVVMMWPRCDGFNLGGDLVGLSATAASYSMFVGNLIPPVEFKTYVDFIFIPGVGASLTIVSLRYLFVAVSIWLGAPELLLGVYERGI